MKFLQDKKYSFLERKKQRRRTHLLFIWTASHHPEVPSLKLIQVPSHNSAVCFANPWGRLAVFRFAHPDLTAIKEF